MPKNKGDPNSPKKKKKSTKIDSDSDSSSDYDPLKNEFDDMSTIEMQRFMQKIFPSKSGKERLKQLEKIDKLIGKKSKKKSKTPTKSRKNKTPSAPKKKRKSLSKSTKKSKRKEEPEDTEEEEIDDEETEETEEDEEVEYEFDEEDEDYLDEEDMQEFMKNNMKFNIIFSVPQGGMGQYDAQYIDDGDTDEESEEEFEDNNEKRDSEEEDDEEEKVADKKSPKSKKQKRLEKLKDKSADDVTEEEWMDMFEEQEKEMKKDGTYYNTKYNKNDKVLIKMKGWDDFKQGKIQRVHKRSRSMRAKYDIILIKKYKGKKVYKSILSRNIKSLDKHKSDKNDKEEDTLLNELKQLLDAKKEGDSVLQNKFDELAKAKAKKDEKIQKKKDAKLKEKNFFNLRKLLREKNVMNDFKYFKTLELDVQEKILTKLKDINSFSNIEKPYRISLIESNIPVEFKSFAMKKVNTLEYMDPSSGEYYKNKQWVDTFMRIPFNKHASLPISIKDGPEKCQEFIENAKNILDKAVYGLEDAKLQILQMIGQWISNPDAIGTAIAVKGPPGTGKTTLIKEGVSKILNRPFAFLALGGATDSSFLEGHSYTYEGSHWGKIVDILINCKCMNPVFYFDELDKISQTPKGEEIVGILTHMTDTSQNDKFHDKYFANIDFDLSKSMFIFSYNEESKVNPILKDRMYRIQTDGYKTDDKWVIARDYLIPKIEENVNFEKGQIIFPEETVNHISNNLTDKEKGVRNLKRCLEIIYTKLNLYRLMKKGSVLFDKKEIITVEFPFTVTIETVQKLIKKTKETSAPFGMYI
jgi:ATP-dependent Lon protease